MTTKRAKTETKKTTARPAQWFIREIKRRVKTDPARAIRFDVKLSERAAVLNAYSTIAEGRPEADDDRPNIFTARREKKPRGAVPVKLSLNGWQFWRDEPLAPGKRGDVERWAIFPPDYVWPQPVERLLVATVKDTIAKRLDTAALAQKAADALRAKYEKIQAATGQDYFVEMVGATASEPDPAPGLYCHVWKGADWLLVSRAEFYPAEVAGAITDMAATIQNMIGVNARLTDGHGRLAFALAHWVSRQLKEATATTWTEDEARLFALLITPHGTTANGVTKYMPQREIAVDLGVSAMAVKRREDKLRRDHPGLAAWLIDKGITRKPRGTRKETVTNPKTSA